MPAKIKDRFAHIMSKVGDSKVTDCWIWQGPTTKGGYGIVLSSLAHRVMYEEMYGDIPDKMVVMHTCDTPACCNPLHLKLGSQLNNMHDMLSKGRARFVPSKNEKNGRCVVTNEQVLEIRELYKGRQNRMTKKTGYTLDELAAMYGVGRTQICRIIKGEARKL